MFRKLLKIKLGFVIPKIFNAMAWNNKQGYVNADTSVQNERSNDKSDLFVKMQNKIIK